MLMPRFIISFCLVFCTIASSSAEDQLDRFERIANEISGDFSGSQSVGYDTVLFTARQEGNKFPSYWSGKWGAGNLVVNASFDPFDEVLLLRATGGFDLIVRNPANYVGLEELIPLQALVSDLRNAPLSIRFENLTNWKLSQDQLENKKKPRKKSGYQTDAVCTVVFKFKGQDISFPGQRINFSHSDKSPIIRLSATLNLDGEKLGLPVSQHGPLTLSIRAVSPTGKLIKSDSSKSAGELLGF